jgi:hypothetical protein
LKDELKKLFKFLQVSASGAINPIAKYGILFSVILHEVFGYSKQHELQDIAKRG